MASTAAPCTTQVRGPVEPDVEPAVLAECHRRAAAEDHSLAGVRQLADPFLALAAQTLVLMAGRGR